MDATHTNEPAQPPDLEGIEGQAWRVGSPSPLGALEEVLSRWLVCQGDNWYGVSVICSRPAEELLASRHIPLGAPDATHELAFFRLGARLPNLQDGAHGDLPRCVFRYAFIARKDQDAVHLLDLIVEHICEGTSPETDSDYWRGCVSQTAEHLLFNCHPSLN